VIAFLTAIFGKRGNSSDRKRMRLARDRELPYPRVLIISPGSVMLNWERELNTVCSLDAGADVVVGMVAYCIIPWLK
jgi:SNF2 family DNA or RNA helicase